MAATDNDVVTNALLALRKMRSRLEAIEQERTEPIAVIGLGCRFPGAPDPDAYWELLREGRESIRDIPADRWDVDALYDPDPAAPGKMYARRGGFVDGLDRFDAGFFGISPREAANLDPQQRLLLEVSWEAFEHAGLAADRLHGSRSGVFVGISTSDYQCMIVSRDLELADAYGATGTSHCTAAGRLSYLLGLEGPCFAVDTACSSSLVAVHQACQSLRTRECDLALAGGVNAILAPELTINFCKARMLAPDGRCKTFDAAADGYARGEGCGMVVLKRLGDARRDRDRILALVRGSAVNQDGRSAGLTVPSGPAQQRVVESALAQAGLAPSAVQYVEAHGTGTSLGDPIEVQALAAALGASRAKDAPLLIGSVKANIGHLEAGAGVSGFIKVVLALQHGELPAHRNFHTPNPKIPWDRLAVEVVRERRPWPAADRRIAGVSAFGFGGTNAHVVLEEAPAPVSAVVHVEKKSSGAETPGARPRHVLPLSARSAPALQEMAGRYASWLEAHPEADLADVCYTAAAGRCHFEQRAALVAATPEETRTGLAALARGETPAGTARGQARSRSTVAWLFTGQGSQYAGMARELYGLQPVFRAALDRCASVLDRDLGRPLLPVIFGDDAGLIDQTTYTQPALFAVEWALAELWRSWGVEPDALLGHSVGEYAAACVAGIFSVEDGLRLIARRGRLMGALPAGGGMAAVLAGDDRVTQALAGHPELAVAAFNGANTVVSGPVAALDRFTAELAAQGIKAQRLATSHAFHSALLEPMLDEFESFARTIPHSPARLPFLSNLTGRAVEPGEAIDAGYWRRHARQPVRFAAGVQELAARGCDVLLEIGPSPVLLGMAQRCWPGEASPVAVPSLRRGRGEGAQLAEAAAQLYVQGVPIELAALDPSGPRQRLALPTYPFQRQRYWMEKSPLRTPARRAGDVHPLLGTRVRAAAARGKSFEQSIDLSAAPWLGDHCVFEEVVFPGAGYAELALSAAEVLGLRCDVTQLLFQTPLVYQRERPVWLQTAVTPGEDGGASVEIFSQGEGEDAWTLHSTARLEPRGEAEPAGTIDLAALQARCGQVHSKEAFYGALAATGLCYGPFFQAVESISIGNDEVVARIALPAALVAGAGQYRLHPVLLDGCLQTVPAILPRLEDSVYLPLLIERLQVVAPVGTALWCHTCLRASDSEKQTLDLCLFDDGGAVVARVVGLRFARVSRQKLMRLSSKRAAELLYQITWQGQERPQPSQGTGTWLIVTDKGGIGAALARRLRAQGHGSTEITAADAGPAELRRVLDAVARATPPLRGVAFFGALDAGPGADAEACCTGALHVVQALVERGERLDGTFFITRGAQAVEAAEDASPAQSALWGLGRVVATEHPELHPVLLDLDPGFDAADAAAVDALAAELLAADSEPQRALRGRHRHVARLARPAQVRRLAYPEGNWQLQPRRRGSLDELTLASVPATPPGAGEVQVRVRAAGLNFRDVLNALGLYPGDPGPLGGECAGEVLALGSGVTELALGDAVFGLAPGVMAHTVNAPAALLVRKPARLDFADVAGLPIVYCTSYLAFELARLRRGERVLIHAGAGGVGLAAIQLARRIGAEVFATASAGKQAYLHSLGIRHVFSSRDLSFADGLLAATGGAGVDVVLNSLTSEGFIAATLRALAPGGRFVEIGKRSIWSPEQMTAERPDVAYHILALDDLMRHRPAQVHDVLGTVAGLLEAGEIEPVRQTVYPMAEAPAAFRLMQQARHIGKIVLSVPPGGDLRADASYLITGGLGALGLELAEWLAARGARHLVLVSRRPPGDDARKVLDRLRAEGCEPDVLSADLGQADDVRRLLATIDAKLPPLRGIFHAAGVLEECRLQQQTAERFAGVLAAKAQGAWQLHEQTRQRPLDFFVLYSSVAAALGPMGLGSYAAANAYLDGLKRHRRAHGLPALSVNWGPWAGSGMAATTEQGQRAWKAQGVTLLEPARALAALGQLIEQDSGESLVFGVEWDRFVRAMGGRRPPLLANLLAATGGAASNGPALGERLRSIPHGQREALVMEHLRGELKQVLGLAEAIDPDAAITDLGLDSLMAVELRNRIQGQLPVEVPVSLLFEGASVRRLAAELVKQLPSQDGDAAPERNGTTGAESSIDWAAELTLDADIRVEPGASPAATPPKAILLTGATGFLGSFLLDELLRQTDADVYCLVRCQDAADGMARIQKSLETYLLDCSRQRARIIPIPGDLEKPLLELTAATHADLCDRIDVVYHNAARLHFLHGYGAMKASNVAPTRELLRLASRGRVKPFHHVSTVAVLTPPAPSAERVADERELPGDPSRLENGYAQSKCVAEHLVRQAGSRGLPVTVYRPAAIIGSSATGACTTQDLFAHIVRAEALLGIHAPSRLPVYSHLELNPAPVDYVSRAIVHLSRQADSAGQTFHLANPEAVSYDKVLEMGSSAGILSQETSAEEWRSRLLAAAERLGDPDLHAVAAFYPPSPSGSAAQVGRLRIDCAATQTALAKASIVCPAIDANLVRIGIAYYERIGFWKSAAVVNS